MRPTRSQASRRKSESTAALIKHRLAAQQLTAPSFDDPAKLVSWMGAVQAQDYSSAKWAVGLRLRASPTEAEIERAISDGRIIRTHAFRGTWQLIAPEDVRWMCALVQSRVASKAAGRHRELELDAATLKRSSKVIVKAIEKNGPLTRDELGAALKAAKISPNGQRLPHILGYVELQGLICGGPRRAKQFTWKLLETPADGRSEDEALAELATRFFQSRGPATVGDFTWWTGLTTADANRAIDGAKRDLASEELDGELHWRSSKVKAANAKPRAVLLPGFDEWLVGYRNRNRDAVVDPVHKGPINAGGGIIGMCVALEGTIVGTWRRELGRKGVHVAVTPFEKLTARDEGDIALALERYAQFLELPRR